MLLLRRGIRCVVDLATMVGFKVLVLLLLFRFEVAPSQITRLSGWLVPVAYWVALQRLASVGSLVSRLRTVRIADGYSSAWVRCIIAWAPLLTVPVFHFAPSYESLIIMMVSFLWYGVLEGAVIIETRGRLTVQDIISGTALLPARRPDLTEAMHRWVDRYRWHRLFDISLGTFGLAIILIGATTAHTRLASYASASFGARQVVVAAINDQDPGRRSLERPTQINSLDVRQDVRLEQIGSGPCGVYPRLIQLMAHHRIIPEFEVFMLEARKHFGFLNAGAQVQYTYRVIPLRDNEPRTVTFPHIGTVTVRDVDIERIDPKEDTPPKVASWIGLSIVTGTTEEEQRASERIMRVDRVHVAGNRRVPTSEILERSWLCPNSMFHAIGIEGTRAEILRMGFFEEVSVSARQGRRAHTLDIDVNVVERNQVK